MQADVCWWWQVRFEEHEGRRGPTGEDWAAIWRLEPVCQTVQRATGDMGAAVVSPSGIEDAMSGSIACVQQVLAVAGSEG